MSEIAVSGDFGVTWNVYETGPGGADSFAVHCGERGWYDTLLLFVGQFTGASCPVDADSVRLAINKGVTDDGWVERRGGLPDNVDVTSIQILYEHGSL